MTLTLNFQGPIWNLLYLSQKWSDCHKTKSKHIDWTLGLKFDNWVWPWPWPWLWIFQGHIWNLLYLSQKWSNYHKMKCKQSIELEASNVTIRFDLGHDLDLWIFKVKYGICYISAKNGPFATERKANISIELQASNVTIRFDLGHDLDLWIFKVKCDLELWPNRHGIGQGFSWSNFEIAVSQNGMWIDTSFTVTCHMHFILCRYITSLMLSVVWWLAF